MIQSWLEKAQWDKKPSRTDRDIGWVYVFGSNDEAKIRSAINGHALSWQKNSLLKQTKELLSFSGKKGPVWILRAKAAPPAVSHGGLLEESSYAFFRDQAGALVSSWKPLGLAQVHTELSGTSAEQELGLFTGLEIASYHFREIQLEKALKGLPRLSIAKARGEIDRSLVKDAQARGVAVNSARHLVNLPPNELTPTSYSTMLKKMKWPQGMKLEIWNQQRLMKEKMGLLLAVGQGSSTPPCLVHLKWRPQKAMKVKPIAFVGKGITFDTGGLDLKPSSAMRLMKKDMGGSAAIVGLALWAAKTNYPAPLDFYLALAENSVDAAAFRPSDVVRARNGALVEIDNTDAEGRLVLADALDVAVTQKGADEPSAVINAATLTGAIKVALGADLAGLFSNEDGLAKELSKAGQEAGDLNWRMPLAEKYWANMSSPFADFKNSTDGFGGAITAALFLSRFVRNKP
ncbi:MAG: leucyl aminopeptidase family protein, partial [Bdellovibrionaceae bacterium]|nr:leucyl aminopeptidase family protein [Pseudobdellovibrionaceae bacterium]